MKAEPRLTPMHVMVYTNGLAFVAVIASIVLSSEVRASPPLPPGHCRNALPRRAAHIAMHAAVGDASMR